VTAEGRTLTYAELHERADELARRLAAAPGDRVPTTLSPGLAFCELLHVLPRRGAVLAPGLAARALCSRRSSRRPSTP
jgi:acyl-CoA synthetase (AMP-forming)/AMP-acid ligase II